MSKRRHRLPFGAELDAERVRFRLWAPAASRVELVLYGAEGPLALPMRSAAGGWHELSTDAAGAGTRYRYRIDGGLEVPDPASRSNPDDVHGASAVVDAEAFEWRDDDWRGRPWHEAVIYELHVGAFSPEGTFAGAIGRLDHLVALGVNTIELMPLADFPGRHGWGYDGVLPYAPDAAYGPPDDLKALVSAAHARGLSVMLDVVYNHFGPDGNYLHAYAPQFFTDRHQTPWGAAINFDGEDSRAVRDFFIHNALYWLAEYHFDGLRLDAVHAIRDDSPTHILTELARAVRAGPGRDRPIHLVLENFSNEARYLGPPGGAASYDAQWNDDEHHCLHVILTGETEGYYGDYARASQALLGRCLAEGFAYQGERSQHDRNQPRGEHSAHLPPTAFVPFLQNHDQIGNRAFGERLAQLAHSEEALLAAAAVVLLAPSPPLLFMGEEWGALEPFPYFCDFGPELAARVREGRRREFGQFSRFRDDAVWQTVPDPTDAETFRSARLDWGRLAEPRHARWLARYRELLAIRRREIAPRIPQIRSAQCIAARPDAGLAVDWRMEDGGALRLLANLGAHPVPAPARAAGTIVFATHLPSAAAELAPWSVTWLLERGDAGS
ncbi:MAG: malto-oligosyltrehalose trehalohydrolase [Candidatus Binatia bacterium]